MVKKSFGASSISSNKLDMSIYSTSSSSIDSDDSCDYSNLAKAVIWERPQHYQESTQNTTSIKHNSLPKINNISLISASLIAQQLIICDLLNRTIDESNISSDIKDKLFNILSDATHIVCEYTNKFKAMPLNEWDNFCNKIVHTVEKYKKIPINDAIKIKDIANTNVPFDYIF